MNSFIRVGLIGAGQRGYECFGDYALRHPDKFKFTAVCDIDSDKLKRFADVHNIPEKYTFQNYKDLFSLNNIFDAVIIATMDKFHKGPALLALENKYPLLLEKPIAGNLKDILKIIKKAEEKNVFLQIVHPLRYTSIMQEIKRIIDSGKIGDIVSIQHNENVGNIHFSHSFVRGNWRNSDMSTPMIVQKSCHDMDLLVWFINKKPLKVVSFGDLVFFNKKNKPKGAPERCLLGCPYEEECPYSVNKIYLTENTNWPVSVISIDKSFEARYEALLKGPYGRCVFDTDNNVVDHQVVMIGFEDKVTVSFQMVGHTFKEGRTLKIMGTKGEIRASTLKNEIELSLFYPRSVTKIYPEASFASHLGGDERLLNAFYNVIKNNDTSFSLSSGREALLGHILAFAAEESRLNNKICYIDEFIRNFNI